MVDFMKEIVVSVILQELLSRAISFALEKRKEKVSQEEFLERIRTSVDDMEFALERSRKLPITDISLLRRRKEIQAACALGRCLLNKDEPEQEVKNQPVTRSSFHEWITCHGKKFPFLPMLGLSKEGFLKSSDARVFERHADSAGKFLRDVESGCSLWHHTFCCPLVRHLLEGKTLVYESRVKKQSKSVRLYLHPMIVEGRGVEVRLVYDYFDRRMPEKGFYLSMKLRISEDTDIIGITIKCMEWWAAQFRVVLQSAIGEFKQLPNLQGIFHSNDPPPSFMEDDNHAFFSKLFRPDPICCNGNIYTTLANKSSIEIPEPVIVISFSCCISAPRNNLRSAPLFLGGTFAPHRPCHSSTEEIYVRYGGKDEMRYGSVQQLQEIARSDGHDYLVHEPEPTDYTLFWYSPHGGALLILRQVTPRPGRRVSKRKR